MRTDSFEFYQGTLPILISMPHNGSQIPEDISGQMQPDALKSVDTDWYLDRLYQFAIDNGCYCINPRFSRYVIDLNRPEDDENLYPGQDTTGLCPTTQFSRAAIYKEGCQPNQAEIDRRIEHYWRPYHNQLQSVLAQIREKFGAALLFEAHSIKSVVPRFFDGVLADFNFGNNNQLSCSPNLIRALESWSCKDYSKVINGRFKGGYITRAYGKPDANIHSIQLELSQATYMDEVSLSLDDNKASKVSERLAEMFEIFNDFIIEQTNNSGVY